MKSVILVGLLVAGIAPGMAQSQSQRGLSRAPSLEQRVADLERVAAERLALESDLAKPCTGTAPFGCRTSK